MKIVEVTQSEIQYRIYAPGAFKRTTLMKFAELITQGGETNNRNINRNLREAHAIAFARKDGEPIAVAIVKNPHASYRDKVFTAAGVSELAPQFNLELGYVMTNPAFRGQGVSTKLMALIQQNVRSPMFSTTRQNNSIMNQMLQAGGFKQTGNPYDSTLVGKHKLILWTK